MDELITLNLTLKELQQIDKYVEINDDTLSVIMKITNAYPQPKSPAEEAYYAVYGWYPPTVGTKCPETKLEVKKMTEIEKTKKDIEVLTAKLALLEEIENHKSPAEIAYKRVYGAYPMGEPFWIVFKKGYEGAQEDYKVGEYQPTSQEPEELKTLYDVLRELDKPMFTDDVCSAVKRWMSQYADNVLRGECMKGYEYCLTVLEENLKND